MIGGSTERQGARERRRARVRKRKCDSEREIEVEKRAREVRDKEEGGEEKRREI